LNESFHRKARSGEGPHDPARDTQTKQHTEGRTVGGCGECRECEQQRFFGGRQLFIVRGEQEQREHGKAGKDIGDQHAGEPGQCRGQNQRHADCSQPQRLGHAHYAQHQMHHPQRYHRLECEIDPEEGAFAEMQIKPVHCGAAGNEIALIPAREITAGIVLEQRVTIPDRRGDQQHRDGGDRQGGAGDPKRRLLGGICGQSLRANDVSPFPRPATCSKSAHFPIDK